MDSKRDAGDKRSVFGDGLRGDVRFGARSLRRNSGFLIIAVLSLALGIALTTTAFAVVDAVHLRKLPFPDAERLVLVEERDASGYRAASTVATFQAWQSRLRTLRL